MARASAPSKPNLIRNHPPYAEMIFSAIRTMNEKKGSSKKAIGKFIEATYPSLPPSHSALLTLHLRRLKNKGRLAMVNRSFMLPKKPQGAVSGEKRLRGRPPKAKSEGASVSMVPRRGRPPKAKPAGAPITVALQRGRGRLPKPMPKPKLKPNPKSKLKPNPLAVGPIAGVKRGRGRPKKVEGGGTEEPKKVEGGAAEAPKKRGRPPKKTKIDVVDSTTSPKSRRGRPRKAEGRDATEEGAGGPRGRRRKLAF